MNYLMALLISLCSPFALSYLISEETCSVQPILYAMHSGNLRRAIELYEKLYDEKGVHDIDLVQQIGLILLDKGFRSADNQIQLMTLFGAGISQHERCLYIVEEGLNHSNPEMQLIAINFLANSHYDRADESLSRALRDNHLLIRLEALHHLAEKKHSQSVGQIEALMSKVDSKLLPLFPEFFALVGNDAAIKALKRLLTYPNEAVRVAAILSVAKYERDDLLPQIRKLALQHDKIQQEACVIALGLLHDDKSFHRIRNLTHFGVLNTQIAAWQALYRLGDKQARLALEKYAKEGNLFAIGALGEMTGSEDTLFALTQQAHLHVRFNASLALLERQDPRCLTPLLALLIADSRDLSFTKIHSLSGGLTAWKVIPSASHNLKDNPLAFELALNLREATLKKMLNFPQKVFLDIAEKLFQTHQNDLVPILVKQLENLGSTEAIQLLKRYAEKAGAPLIRNYCNLALFNLKEEGPYRANLCQWIANQQEEDFIRLRPSVPWSIACEGRDLEVHYALSPDETSKLLIETFEAFARTQEDQGITLLLTSLLNGNSKNRYALAGLLIRATL